MHKYLIFFLLSCAVIATHINEVMYNPPGSDNNLEYVEVYTNESLINWTVGDSAANDTLKLLKLGNTSFALIVEQDYLVGEGTYYSAGASIGNNLNNDQDCVYLYSQDRILVDSMCYDGTLANNNNHSLEYDGSWHESEKGGTPGMLNSWIGEKDVNSTEINDTVVNTTNETNGYALNETKENDTWVNVSMNETGADSILANDTIANMNDSSGRCNVNLSISSEKELYQEGEKVKYRIETDADDYVIEYWVEDIEGEVVKSKYNSTNTNERTYTPGCGVFLIKANLYACANASAVLLFFVNCSTEMKTYGESISIEEISGDEKAQFGEIVRVKLKISKGDTSKSVIEMWAQGDEKVSETTKMNIYDKDTEIEVNLPLALKSNCDEDFDDGRYELVVSGLGVEDRKQFDIFGQKTGFCKTEYKEIIPECLECDRCPVCEACEKPEIKSFYTLAKKYSDKLRLFANVECDNCSVVLLGDNVSEFQVLGNHSGRLDFNVSYSQNYSVFVCEDSSSLMMDFSMPKIGNTDVDPFRKLTADTIVSPVYESKNQKIIRRIKYFVLGALGILGIIILFKKF